MMPANVAVTYLRWKAADGVAACKQLAVPPHGPEACVLVRVDALVASVGAMPEAEYLALDAGLKPAR